MKIGHSGKSKLITKKVKGFLAILLICTLLLSLFACGRNGSSTAPTSEAAAESKTVTVQREPPPPTSEAAAESKTVTVQREPPPLALQAANDAGAIALQQYIYARLKTEDFITANFTAMKLDEISVIVDELSALWQTSQQLTRDAEGIADQALLVLDAPKASRTTNNSGSNIGFIPLAAKPADNKVLQFANVEAQKWAEELTAKYDAIKGGQTIKQLANQLGTDAKSVYQQLVAAQEIIKSGAEADADYYDKLMKVAQATKTACKVGMFVTATVVSGGGSLTALAGSSMTLAEAGAIVLGGTDAIVDVATTGSSIVLGDNHQCTIGMNSIKDKLAPVSAVIGLTSFNTDETYSQIAYIGDTLTDWFYDGKILGIQVSGSSNGTEIKANQVDTSNVTEANAASAIEKMGFIPPEKQTATITDVTNTYKTTKEDAIAAIDALKAQMLAIAKAAGVLNSPVMEELVGSWEGNYKGTIVLDRLEEPSLAELLARMPMTGDTKQDDINVGLFTVQYNDSLSYVNKYIDITGAITAGESPGSYNVEWHYTLNNTELGYTVPVNENYPFELMSNPLSLHYSLNEDNYIREITFTVDNSVQDGVLRLVGKDDMEGINIDQQVGDYNVKANYTIRLEKLP